MNPLGRYGSVWSRSGPPGVFTPAMFRPGAPIALQVHRRVLTGYASGRLAPAVWPASVWRGGRWLAERSDLAVDEELQERFEDLTGVPVERQNSRLTVLAGIGIGSVPAYRFGLLLDGAKDTWMNYVYDHEIGWNVAAGGLATAASVRLLSDKWETAQRLRAAGIPVVASRRIEAGTVVSEVVLRRWLDGDDEVFLKPIVGSRGDGGCVLSGPDLCLVPYQSTDAVDDPVAFVQGQVADRDYLVQARLRSHAQFAGVADPSDVVTVRVVTRDVGEGPRIFSTVVEVPLPPTPEGQFYQLIVVDEDGHMVGRPRPPWYPPPAADSDSARVFVQLHGRTLPDHELMRTEALAAHRQFPGVFAIAWDIAVTDAGPVFLEGNGGFGTMTPQVASGGLLVGLAHLH